MGQTILDKVPECTADRVGMPVYFGRAGIAERDGATASNSKGRQFRGDVGNNCTKVGAGICVNLKHRGVRQIEHLVDQALHPLRVGGKPRFCLAFRQLADTQHRDGQRRPKFVGSITGKMLHRIIATGDRNTVWLTWRDAAEVPVVAGPFSLDDNIAYVVEMLRYLGGATHLIGLYQSALPALAAAAIVADEQARPASLTLIGGKLDTRINPIRVDSPTRTLRLEWFEDYAIITVSAFRPGRRRRVYPGGAELMMLSTYLLPSLRERRRAFRQDPARRRGGPLWAILFSNCSFQLSTCRRNSSSTRSRVFHDAALADERLAWRGSRIATEAITGTRFDRGRRG